MSPRKCQFALSQSTARLLTSADIFEASVIGTVTRAAGVRDSRPINGTPSRDVSLLVRRVIADLLVALVQKRHADDSAQRPFRGFGRHMIGEHAPGAEAIEHYRPVVATTSRKSFALTGWFSPPTAAATTS
jgi:hypothetical protein